jgi:C1A family cysteine protease
MVAFPTFAAWAATYGKVYNGDESIREAIYNANIEYINQNNEDGTMGPWTPFMDMSREEFQAQYISGIQGEITKGDAYLGQLEYSGAELPDDVDWSDSAHGAVTDIKDQGSCGSCWAFSTTGSLEGRTQIATGQLTALSEQQFVDCDTKFGDQGCNGGLMDNAFQYAMQADICTESSYSYKGKGGSCKESSCTVALKKSQITGYQDVAGNEQALAEAVSQGPVSVAVCAVTIFQFYNKGVVTSNLCGAMLDHGVLAVGYGTDSGTKYWKVKNSWGKSWGENGYIRLQKGKGGKGECGILSGPPSYPVISSSVTV